MPWNPDFDNDRWREKEYEVSMITGVNILDFIEQCMRDGMTENEAELMADVVFNLHEPEEIEHEEEEEAW